MPELAEVEYFRKCWDCGLGRKTVKIHLHAGQRVARGIDGEQFRKLFLGSVLLSSEARGKQMLFRFSKGLWLGLHLGMTGKLRVEKTRFCPARHDHLVVHQKAGTLVFSDPRQFGRIRFHCGPSAPEWWSKLPLGLDSKRFTPAVMESFLQRHEKLPIKAALLLQAGFPGVGNWMADEILWRAQMHPRLFSGKIRGDRFTRLWRMVRYVCRGAMKHVSKDFSDPPRGWFYHERWKRDGRCPIHKVLLDRATIGGRTTAWCPQCQQ
jgi:formamidopyrimidine-DNA glycosylase